MKTISSQTFRFVFVVLTLFVVCFINYAGVLEHEFMLDDGVFLRQDIHELYNSIWDYFSINNIAHYSPLYYLVNNWLFSIYNDSPSSLHFINILLFYLCCVLMYLLLSAITQNDSVSFLCAFFFSLHPVNAFTVNYITCNVIFLYAIFLELSLIFFWLHFKARRRYLYFIFSIIFYLLSVFAFEAALLLPLYVFLLAYILNKSSFKNSLWVCLPYLFFAFIFLSLWFVMASAEADLIEKYKYLHLSAGSYSATLLLLCCWYVINLILPSDIVFIRNIFPVTESLWFWNILLLSFVVLAVIFIFKIYKKNLKSLALLWFFAGFSLVAVACLNHPGMGLVIQPHWLFIPSMGFFLFISIILVRLDELLPKGLGALLIGCLALYYGLSSHHYHELARTEKGYCQYWLQESPGNIIAAQQLGKIYFHEGQYEKALVYHEYVADKYFKRATRAKIYHNIGVIYEKLLLPDKARENYFRSMNLLPDYAPPRIALSLIKAKNN